MQIITRQEAKEKGLSRYFTGKACIHGHVAERWVKNWICTECSRLHGLSERKTNGKKVRQRAKDWYNKNKEHVSQYRKDNCTEESKQKAATRARMYYQDNKQYVLMRMKSYYIKNPSKILALAARRKSDVRQATPPWVDMSAIVKVHEARENISIHTGVQHHVDHYYPIKGKTICGLNVPWNLQIITAEENLAKGNKMPEEFYGANHTMSQPPASAKYQTI